MVGCSMSPIPLVYEDFMKRVQGKDAFEVLAEAERVIHVYALTRDRCAGCQTQKPLFEKLAASMSEKYGGKVRFGIIHVSENTDFRMKLQDLRRVLKFAAYPTYLILIKTEIGVVETYRGIEPPMDEIARNIDLAVELVNR